MKILSWASLVAQWLKISLPMQETQVRSHIALSNEALEPQLLILYSRAPEQQLLSPHAATPEARTNALDPLLHNKKSHCSEKPPHGNYKVAAVYHNYRKACAMKTQYKHKRLSKIIST